MRIAIIGGHGKVAMFLAPLLTGAGHQVTSLIRNPAHADEVNATGAVAVVADVEHLDVDGIARHLVGHDAVVWTAGAGGGDPERTYAVDRDAAIRSMDAADSARATRYLMVSYFGAGPDHGVSPDSSFYASAEAKAAADAHLMASALDWTILAPSGLTNDSGTGLVDVAHGDTDDMAGSSVAREDVARMVAATLECPRTAGAVISFNQGSTPVADAVALFEH